jgi:hypothetical protein
VGGFLPTVPMIICLVVAKLRRLFSASVFTSLALPVVQMDLGICLFPRGEEQPKKKCYSFPLLISMYTVCNLLVLLAQPFITKVTA